MSNFTLSKSLKQSFLINYSEIEGRLDPYFYRPEIRDFSKYPIEFRKLSLFTDSIKHPPEYERKYSASGYQLIRAQNVKPLGIEIENNQVFFSKEVLAGKNLIFPEIGKLLIVRSGVNAGDTAVIEKEYKEAIIGADNLLVKVNDSIIPKFLQVFFFTDFGKRLMNRYLTGATNKHINPVNLGKIPIPILTKDIQLKAIQIFETLIALKKENEAKAEELLSSIDDYLLNELGIKLPEPPENTLKNRTFYSTIKNLSGQRFDPKLYSPYTIALMDCIQHGKYKHVPLRDLIIHSASGDWGIDEDGNIDKDLYYKCIVIRATEFDNKFNLNLSNDRVKYRYLYKEKYASLNIQENDLLIEKSGGSENQPVGRIAILEKKLFDNGKLGYSNFVHKIRLSKEILPQFAFNYLKTLHNIKITDILQSQTNGIRNLILSQYFNLPVPIPSPDMQKQIAQSIDNTRKQAKDLQERTLFELDKANKEIERIILKGN